MINYLKSEQYRLLRKTGFYLTGAIGLLLIVAAALVLYAIDQADPNFPYARNDFFYANVISSGILIIIVGFLYNIMLTGKDMTLIKQSISFGVSRTTIFWSKFILTLSAFLLICVVGIGLTIVLGEKLMTSEEQWIGKYLIAIVNMIPLVLSGFSLIHTMKLLKVGEVYIIIVLLFTYVISGDMLRLLFRPIAGLNELYHYAPDTLLNENLMNYMDETVQFGYHYWVTGLVITAVALFIGVKRFASTNID